MCRPCEANPSLRLSFTAGLDRTLETLETSDSPSTRIKQIQPKTLYMNQHRHERRNRTLRKPVPQRRPPPRSFRRPSGPAPCSCSPNRSHRQTAPKSSPGTLSPSAERARAQVSIVAYLNLLTSHSRTTPAGLRSMCLPIARMTFSRTTSSFAFSSWVRPDLSVRLASSPKIFCW